MKFPNFYFKRRKRPAYLRIMSFDGSKNLFDKSKSQLKGIQEGTPVEAWAAVAYSNENVMNMLKPNATYKISYNYECVSVPNNVKLNSTNIGFVFYSGVDANRFPLISTGKSHQVKVGDKSSHEVTFATPATFHDDGNDYRMLCYTNRYIDDNGNDYKCSVIFRNIRIVEV